MSNVSNSSLYRPTLKSLACVYRETIDPSSEVLSLHLTLLYLQMGKLDHENAWVQYEGLNVVIKPAVWRSRPVFAPKNLSTSHWTAKILIFQKLRHIDVLCESLKVNAFNFVSHHSFPPRWRDMFSALLKNLISFISFMASQGNSPLASQWRYWCQQLIWNWDIHYPSFPILTFHAPEHPNVSLRTAWNISHILRD